MDFRAGTDESNAPAEQETVLTGDAADAYLTTITDAANAAVGFNADKLATDARAMQNGDPKARTRLLSSVRYSRARAFWLSRRVVVRPVLGRRPNAARRPRGRAVRGGVRARSPSRQDPDSPGPASGRPQSVPVVESVRVLAGLVQAALRSDDL